MIIWGIDLWIVFITVIVILSITVIIILYRLHQQDDNDFKYVKYKKIKKTLRTGDILAVSYPSYRGKLIKIFTGSWWAHTVMVVKKGKDMYVYEMARYHSDEQGLLLKPIEDWIDWNEEYTIALRKYDGVKKFPKKKLQRLLVESSEYEVDMSVVSWLKTSVRRKYKPEDKDYYYCSEFIAHMMQSIGIMKKIIIPSSYKPWELLYDDLRLYDGYSYSTPVMLSF